MLFQIIKNYIVLGQNSSSLSIKYTSQDKDMQRRKQAILKEPCMPYFEGLHPVTTEKHYVDTTIPTLDETEIASHHLPEYSWQRTQLFYCKRKINDLKHEVQFGQKDRRRRRRASWFS